MGTKTEYNVNNENIHILSYAGCQYLDNVSLNFPRVSVLM